MIKLGLRNAIKIRPILPSASLGSNQKQIRYFGAINSIGSISRIFSPSYSLVASSSNNSINSLRCFSSSSHSHDHSHETPPPSEAQIKDILTRDFQPVKVEVKDVSGGCGAMFDIYVESSKFNGKSIVAQHKMVNQSLQVQIKGMHGLTIRTKAA